jgi:hypothetical protein
MLNLKARENAERLQRIKESREAALNFWSELDLFRLYP